MGKVCEKSITVIVERADDGSFWCWTENPLNGSVGLNACGSTVEEAKADMLACYEEAKADAVECGKPLPEVSFVYRYDLQSFFNYFSYLNISEVAKRAGINQSLFRQYACGIKNAGEKTYQRLSVALAGMVEDLQTATF